MENVFSVNTANFLLGGGKCWCRWTWKGHWQAGTRTSHLGVFLLLSSLGPPDCRSRSVTCGMARAGGWVDCPDLGCGGQAQGCSTRTFRQHYLHALWSVFPSLDSPFNSCFSSQPASQIHSPSLVTFPLFGPFPRGQRAAKAWRWCWYKAASRGIKHHHFLMPKARLCSVQDSSKHLENDSFIIFHFSKEAPVAGVGQIFHNVVYSSFLGLLHAANACVSSGSSRWNTEERKRLKLLEEHSAVLLLSHACGTSKNNS